MGNKNAGMDFNQAGNHSHGLSGDGSHTHTIDIPDHSHNVQIGQHTHQVDVSNHNHTCQISSTGQGTSFDIKQAYIVLNYIIKV